MYNVCIIPGTCSGMAKETAAITMIACRCSKGILLLWLFCVQLLFIRSLSFCISRSNFKAYYYCQRTLITASVSIYESEIAAVRASASSISICGADVACCLYPAAVQPVSLNTLLRSWYLYNCTPCPFQYSSSQLIVCVSFHTAVPHSCSCSLCYFAA